MKDILHQDLNINDFVVVNKKYGYAGLEIVQIIDFTDFTKSGSFYIKIGENQSSIFKIDSKDILKNLTMNHKAHQMYLNRPYEILL